MHICARPAHDIYYEYAPALKPHMDPPSPHTLKYVHVPITWSAEAVAPVAATTSTVRSRTVPSLQRRVTPSRHA
eukprot:6162497-Prymnesium_polylepis.1